MTQKNETPALIAALLITLGLLGAGGWWLLDYLGNRPEIVDISGGRSDDGAPSSRSNGLASAPYTGESVLPEAVSATKQAGLSAIASGDFATAEAEFTAALAENKNDPESLIYLNNAKIADGEAYTIAVAIPANSEFLGPALEIMRGVAQAQTEINDSDGINGVPLRILLAADVGAPTASADTAESLVENEDVLGVVGHYSSDMTIAAAAVYEEKGLTVISPTSTAEKISEAGDYVFRTVPSDRSATAALARYVRNELDKEKAVIFYTSESAYSLSVRREFTQELLSRGGDVVTEFDVAQAGYSTGQALSEAQSAEAEVIMLALTEETDDASLRVLAVNGGDLPVVGGDSLYDFNILDEGRDSAVGLTVSVPWHILSHRQSPFVQRSQALWGAAVNWRTVTAYDAVMTLAEAISVAGPNREAIASVMSETGFSAEGATSTVKFIPISGDRNQPAQLVTVVKKPSAEASISKTGYDYEPEG